jgi:hypothetical protein
MMAIENVDKDQVSWLYEKLVEITLKLIRCFVRFKSDDDENEEADPEVKKKVSAKDVAEFFDQNEDAQSALDSAWESLCDAWKVKLDVPGMKKWTTLFVFLNQGHRFATHVAGSVFNAMWAVITYFVNALQVFLGCPQGDLKTLQNSGRRWVEVALSWRKRDPGSLDIQDVREVMNHHRDGQELVAQFVEFDRHGLLFAPFLKQWNEFDEWCFTSKIRTEVNDMERPQPHWVYLAGDPGIGKSDMRWFILAGWFEIDTGRQDFDKSLVYQISESKFQDGYNDQLYGTVDDFMQSAIPEDQVALALFVMLNCTGGAVLFESADPKKKGKQLSRLRGFVTPSNNAHFPPLKIASQPALERRRTVCAYGRKIVQPRPGQYRASAVEWDLYKTRSTPANEVEVVKTLTASELQCYTQCVYANRESLFADPLAIIKRDDLTIQEFLSGTHEITKVGFSDKFKHPSWEPFEWLKWYSECNELPTFSDQSDEPKLMKPHWLVERLNHRETVKWIGAAVAIVTAIGIGYWMSSGHSDESEPRGKRPNRSAQKSLDAYRASQSHDQNTSDVQMKVFANIAHIYYLSTEGDIECKQHCTFIDDRHFLANKHFFNSNYDIVDYPSFAIQWAAAGENAWTILGRRSLRVHHHKDADLSICRLPEPISGVRNIEKHFVTEDFFERDLVGNRDLYLVVKNQGTMTVLQKQVRNPKRAEKIKTKQGSVVYGAVTGVVNSVAGDCGAPWMLLAEQYGARIALGIHSAGNKHSGVAHLVSRELVKALKEAV